MQQKHKKKLELQKIQIADQALKAENIKRANQNAQSVDFGDKNVLSYCFEQKAHKSYEMRKRNDYLQKLIADNFMLEDVRKSQAVTSRPELTAFVIDQKRVETKQKEMQTKLFQDL